jgi:DNA repair protein RecN (Recombination protein N)
LLRSLRIENLVLIRAAELEFAPGLNAITGETGAGKTILSQAIGLLLGARGDASMIGADGVEAYIEAELDAPAEILDEDDLEAVRELRPQDEEGIAVARRVFADGRTRAYAWGRSAAREDVAALGERLIAMSGQFEQRRLARPSYQLDVLDAFCGEEQRGRRLALRGGWRELQAARRAHEQLTGDAAAAEERIAGLRALVEDATDLSAGAEASLREERERLRHLTELAAAAGAAAAALAPDDGEGAAGLAAHAGSALDGVAAIAPELGEIAADLREAELRLADAASAVRSFLASLDAEPHRLEHVEAELDRYAGLRRTYRAETTEELVRRTEAARAELDALDAGDDPVAASETALAAVSDRVETLVAALRAARLERLDAFEAAVAAELRGLGVGDGEFEVELAEREPSSTGADEARFLVRANAGLPFAPVSETASGGELSRIALAIAAVGGGASMVFDEIDAGVGGETAHAVADALVRLAGRAQVITITHLPQIASRADRHFAVEKVPGDPTHTRIRELTKEERREEIERMLGGREFLATLAGGT